MRSALIGNTGFVGSNLMKQSRFDAYYNSKNIPEIVDQEFDIVICAGASAVKWWANQNPEHDLTNITRLVDPLKSVRTKKFVLLSTVDVYQNPFEVDEDSNVHSVKNHAYGTHRLFLEDFARDRFTSCHVIRLPGLFGEGLKKNVIFDLINNNCLDVINPNSVFQYYNLDYLWRDIGITIEADLPLVNFATEPVSTRSIIQSFFPTAAVGERAGAQGAYDMRTKYGRLWNKHGRYCYQADEVLRDIGRFVNKSKGKLL